jgi:hypothetical protein
LIILLLLVVEEEVKAVAVLVDIELKQVLQSRLIHKFW